MDGGEREADLRFAYYWLAFIWLGEEATCFRAPHESAGTGIDALRHRSQDTGHFYNQKSKVDER